METKTTGTTTPTAPEAAANGAAVPASASAAAPRGRTHRAPVSSAPPAPEAAGAPAVDATGSDGPKLVTVSELVALREKNRKNPGGHPLITCPNCRWQALLNRDQDVPDSIACPSCKGDFEAARWLNPQITRQTRFFGPTIECDGLVDTAENGKLSLCGERFVAKMPGGGSYNPTTGEGGIWRPCPECGTTPAVIRPGRRTTAQEVLDSQLAAQRRQDDAEKAANFR